MFENVKYQVLGEWLAFAFPSQRIFILYLLSAVVLAFLSWLYYRRGAMQEKPEGASRSFFSYLFDREVFLHRSARQDYIYFFVNAVIYTGIIAQLMISTHFFMMMFHGGFEATFGPAGDGLFIPGPLSLALYTLVSVLLMDFAIFITHYAQHKIPVLWEFHKVHHSAEVLTPITLYRMHPVDMFFTGLVAAMLAALAFAGYYYLSGQVPSAYEVLGLNIIVFLFYVFGYNLRHSHIWLNYPAWVSAIFISPAQHQIHHSTDPKHFDKNLGLIFAFWDRIFGTLYIPRRYEKLTFGISKSKPNPFRNVRDMYLQPVVNAWRLLCPPGKERGRALVLILAMVFFAANYGVFFALDRTIQADIRPLPSVHLEDLTWTEVHRGLHERGYDTVIIPTGGTEQNGPHVILGKHNYVVRHNAGEIAKRLGGTLVAPVIAYVPEDDHMPWAGTVSLPRDMFEKTLIAAAESYIAHGFKFILFIGDSGGNQDGQAAAARAVAEKFHAQGVTAAHIGDYYAANGQMDWLRGKGYSDEQIGGHAGIRDTSEVMFIHDKGVRADPWLIDGLNSGANGDARRASRKIGRVMTELKIGAAIAQIKALPGWADRVGAQTPAGAINTIKP